MINFRNAAPVLTVLALVSCQPATSAPSEVEAFTTAGVRVIHKMVTANDVIAARLYIDGGSATLTPKNAGVGDLYLSIMTRGTEKYNRDAFATLSTTSGSTVASEVNRSYSVATLQAVREHFDDAWDLFTQAVLHPTLLQADLDLVRQQKLFVLKQKTDDPDARLTDLTDSVFYAGHPYSVDPNGTVESMTAMTRDELVAWQKTNLTKSRLLLVVVGNVSKADIEKRIAATFGALPVGDSVPSTVPPIAPTKAGVTVYPLPLPTNYITGIFVAPPRDNADFPAFSLVTQILSDRLFEEVRTKRNLTYAVQAFINPTRVTEGGLYVTTVSADTTLKVILSEVKKLQDDTVSKEGMQETLNEFVTDYWLNQETNMGQASRLGNWELTGGGWKNALSYPDKLKAATPADLQRVAKTYFKDFHFVVVGKPGAISKGVVPGM